jgi:ferric iron reductase protein FhuF
VKTLRELREFVWRKLYAENLAPLFARTLEVTKVATNLCWTNAAEWVANVSDAADEYLPPEAARPYYDDRIALLEAPAIPGIAGPNPLRGLMDWLPYEAPDFPHGVQTRGICCVTYMLPDRLGRLCQNCGFLPIQDRVDLIRERHGKPMGTPGGPAQARTRSMIAADQALQAALDRAVESVGPLARSYPICLTAPAGVESIAAVDLFQPDTLRSYAARAVKEWSDRPLDEDPRAAVSRLIRRYLGSVITAALVPLVHGVGLELAPERVRVIMQSDLPQGTVVDIDEVLVSAERPATGPVHGTEVATIAELRDRVFAALLSNISWSFAAIMANIKVSPNLLWSTAAEQVDLLWEYAIDGPAPATFAAASADREQLLFAKELPGMAGPNPMRDLLYWEPAGDRVHQVQVRRVCCANFVVPGRTQGYCRNCDLISEERRLAMWDEYRGASLKRGG